VRWPWCRRARPYDVADRAAAVIDELQKAAEQNRATAKAVRRYIEQIQQGEPGRP